MNHETTGGKQRGGSGGGGLGWGTAIFAASSTQEVQCLMFRVIPSIRPCLPSTVHPDVEDRVACSSKQRLIGRFDPGEQRHGSRRGQRGPEEGNLTH